MRVANNHHHRQLGGGGVVEDEYFHARQAFYIDVDLQYFSCNFFVDTYVIHEDDYRAARVLFVMLPGAYSSLFVRFSHSIRMPFFRTFLWLSHVA